MLQRMLSRLETTVPPLFLTLVAALLALLAPKISPGLVVDVPGSRLVALLLALLGTASCALGVIAFRWNRTTTNPFMPDKVTSLVIDGIYRYTRNPMYLGFALILAACVVWSGSLLGSLLLPGFVFYLSIFQIRPEERALKARFGLEFAAYSARVPRWI